MNAIEENALQADVIFACGPMPMLRAIKKYAEEKEIKAYIALEEHMACGVGACLGCVVKTKDVYKRQRRGSAFPAMIPQAVPPAQAGAANRIAP